MARHAHLFFLAEDVVRLSRQIHGGDIGLAVLRARVNPRFSTREMYEEALLVAEPIYDQLFSRSEKEDRTADSDHCRHAARSLITHKRHIPIHHGESVAIFTMYVEMGMGNLRSVVDEFTLVAGCTSMLAGSVLTRVQGKSAYLTWRPTTG